jgi:hypothetical protein
MVIKTAEELLALLPVTKLIFDEALTFLLNCKRISFLVIRILEFCSTAIRVPNSFNIVGTSHYFQVNVYNDKCEGYRRNRLFTALIKEYFAILRANP